MIKETIGRSLVFVSPYYSKNFQVFSFTFEDEIVGVLLYKNDEGREYPISFIIRDL